MALGVALDAGYRACEDIRSQDSRGKKAGTLVSFSLVQRWVESLTNPRRGLRPPAWCQPVRRSHGEDP